MKGIVRLYFLRSGNKTFLTVVWKEEKYSTVVVVLVALLRFTETFIRANLIVCKNTQRKMTKI